MQQEKVKIDRNITVGPQPSVQEIQDLKNNGFKSIVNFRTDGEEDQPLSPVAEASQVRSEGLDYLHIPVSADSLDFETVEKFENQLSRLPKPTYIHCKSGKRSGAMVMMCRGVERGMSGDQVLEKAEEMGFECDQPELRTFVKNYVDIHSRAQSGT